MTTVATNHEVADTSLEMKKTPVVPEYKNLGPVFGKEGMSGRQVTHAKNVGDLRVQIESLKKLQEMNPTPERNQQIIDLDREWGRNTRFMNLHNRGTAEQKKLLEKRETFEDLKASDLLMLKKNGADLANLLLVSDTNPTGSVTRDTIKEKDKFIVNFGESKNINAIIGAGDILPPTVNEVKIISKKYPEGIIATRGYTQRPGYYDNSTKPPTYIAVYDGDKIEVLKMGEISKETLEVSQKAEEDQINHVSQEETREEKIRHLSLEENKSFMENATTLAKAIENEYGIPWQVIVGQAALESGYGKSGLAKDGNYFGIKGSGKTYATREVIDGKSVMINDSFRIYSNIKDSFIDHARFLAIDNRRYLKAFKYAKDINPRPSYYPKDYSPENYNPKKFLEAIWDGGHGYATDDKYIDKIAGVWKTNGIEVA